MADDTARLLAAHNETRLAIEQLRSSTDERRVAVDGELAKVRQEIRDLRNLLVGEKGDNGIASRVMLLERTRSHISWQSIGVIIALCIAAISYFGAGQ